MCEAIAATFLCHFEKEPSIAMRGFNVVIVHGNVCASQWIADTLLTNV